MLSWLLSWFWSEPTSTPVSVSNVGVEATPIEPQAIDTLPGKTIVIRKWKGQIGHPNSNVIVIGPKNCGKSTFIQRLRPCNLSSALFEHNKGGSQKSRPSIEWVSRTINVKGKH